MLPKKHRLSKSAEVKRTTARGRSFFNPYFVLKIVPGGDMVRITVIASVKASKRAVERNRAKRVIRDELRQLVSEFKPGNYALIVKKAATIATPTQLREAIQKTVKSGKITRS